MATTLGLMFNKALSGGEIKHHLLKARDASPLSAELMQRVAHQVEQRCRNVKPYYRPIDEST